MEDNKLFDLVEKMYADLSGKMNKMESRMDNMENKIGSMANKIGSMEGKVGSMENKIGSIEASMATKHDIIRLENKMDENHKALYDGYKLTYKKIEVLEDKVIGIQKHVENQDVEIRVIKNIK